MGVRDALLGLVVAVAGFVAVGVVVTELVSSAIEFSLFVGLPAGALAGVFLGVATYAWLGSEVATARRRGAALAAFGTVFSLALIVAVLVANLRNSQALPLAAVLGVVAAAGASAWLWRSGRAERDGTEAER